VIRLSTSEIAIHEIVTPSRGICLNGYTPLLGAVFGPVVILRRDVAQHLPTDWVDLTIGPEKAYGPLFLLKGLDRGMYPIEATISETDVILMAFVEGVHGPSRGVRSLEHTPVNASAFYAGRLHSRRRPDSLSLGYQGRSPCLVKLALSAHLDEVGCIAQRADFPGVTGRPSFLSRHAGRLILQPYL
jgi:hypothetical protein